MSTEQKTKQTIYNTVRKICSEIGSELTVDFNPDAVDIIAELTYKKLLMYGSDLEAFQKHAKRSTITTDDVKLLVRRNKSLKELVDQKTQQSMANKPADASATGKRKRKVASTSST